METPIQNERNLRFRITGLLVVDPVAEPVTFDTYFDISRGRVRHHEMKREWTIKFLNYYERELTFIREMGAEFAKKYPKIAGRLLLEPDKCEDPHTERLIEAFAFLMRAHPQEDRR